MKLDNLPSAIQKLVDKYDMRQIKMGIEIEREHDEDGPTDVVKNEIDLLKIALAHLKEDPKYYTHLKDMEKKHVNESPDSIYVGDGERRKHLWDYNGAPPSFAFGYDGRDMKISEEGGIHGAIGGRADLDYPGRIWTRVKVISFWVYPPINKLKEVLKDLERTFNTIALGSNGYDLNDQSKDSKWIRGNSYGKIKFDGSWRVDVPSEDGERYNGFASRTGEMRAGDWSTFDPAKAYLYSLKTVLSNKPLKGVGKKWKKGQKIDTDTGKQHVAPAMLKKGKIAKMDKAQKEKIYNYFKAKGTLSPEEKRMYKMIQKDGIEIYVTNDKIFITESKLTDSQKSTLRSLLQKYDGKEIPDEVIHNFADRESLSPHDVESYIYSLASKHVNEVKLFTLEEGTGILTEAPHIEVGDQVIDLEFEKDKTEALKKIIKAMLKLEITDKHGSKFKLKSDKEVNEFMKKVMKNPQVRKLLS